MSLSQIEAEKERLMWDALLREHHLRASTQEERDALCAPDVQINNTHEQAGGVALQPTVSQPAVQSLRPGGSWCAPSSRSSESSANGGTRSHHTAIANGNEQGLASRLGASTRAKPESAP